MEFLSARIASGNLVVEVDLHGDLLCGYFCPAAMTGTLAIKAVDPHDGVAKAINGFTSTFAASEFIPVAEISAKGLSKIEIGSSLAEAADRVFTLALQAR